MVAAVVQLLAVMLLVQQACGSLLHHSTHLNRQARCDRARVKQHRAYVMS